MKEKITRTQSASRVCYETMEAHARGRIQSWLQDGHLGIWAALGELHPAGEEQRCWNHKIVNVLERAAEERATRGRRAAERDDVCESRSACERKRDEFLLRFKKTDPKACATITRDWERLVTFFDYPQKHWIHLRTTNIVESPFNAVRLRTDASRRFKKVENAEAMIWKLLLVAREILARAQRTASDARCLRRKTVQGRNCCAHEDRADKESRLNLFTHLLTRPPRCFIK